MHEWTTPANKKIVEIVDEDEKREFFFCYIESVFNQK